MPLYSEGIDTTTADDSTLLSNPSQEGSYPARFLVPSVEMNWVDIHFAELFPGEKHPSRAASPGRALTDLRSRLQRQNSSSLVERPDSIRGHRSSLSPHRRNRPNSTSPQQQKQRHTGAKSRKWLDGDTTCSQTASASAALDSDAVQDMADIDSRLLALQQFLTAAR